MSVIKRDYDFLIVGAGLFGAVFACEMHKQNKKCLVIDRRSHIGGNAYTESKSGINVHKYGPHIFHTHNKEVWDFVRQFADFNHFVYSPVANYKGEVYNLPFNMNTFNKMWGVITPQEAQDKLSEQCVKYWGKFPQNLEEQALNLVGSDIFEKLIKGYTEKQWGRTCKELPASIIKRLPMRFTYDNNYFSDPYQGIPIGGYTAMIGRMLDGVEVRLGEDYLKSKEELNVLASTVLYTGAIDEYFDYCYGPLEYRSLRFETEYFPIENYQGVAVVNYTDRETPYTRMIEHKHFEFGKQTGTVVTKEYPRIWKMGDEAYYPINDERNQALYLKYSELAKRDSNVFFGGRLGSYRYMDMDDVLESAVALAKEVI